MSELKINRAKIEPDWRFVPELLHFVGPEEHEVIDAIRAELAQDQYRGRMHGERKLYKRGCRGPLCRKAHRDYGRVYMREARAYGDRRRETKLARFDPLLLMYYKAHLVNVCRRALAQAQPPRATEEKELASAAVR